MHIYIYTHQVSNKTQTVIMRIKGTHDKAAPNPYSNYTQVGLTTCHEIGKELATIPSRYTAPVGQASIA